jgi:hypothetical protein
MAPMEAEVSPFVHLADVGDLASARVCAAVLGSEGIEVRIHGESLGPYPMTVGRMAVTQLWVPAPDLERASELMVEAEVEHTLGVEQRGGALADPGALPMRLIALFVAAILATAVVRALMRVF